MCHDWLNDSGHSLLSEKSDSQANQWNQTEVMPATTMLMQKAASPEQTKKTNVRSLFMCVLSILHDCILDLTHVPGVACEDKYFFTTGR